MSILQFIRTKKHKTKQIFNNTYENNKKKPRFSLAFFFVCDQFILKKFIFNFLFEYVKFNAQRLHKLLLRFQLKYSAFVQNERTNKMRFDCLLRLTMLNYYYPFHHRFIYIITSKVIFQISNSKLASIRVLKMCRMKFLLLYLICIKPVKNHCLLKY